MYDNYRDLNNGLGNQGIRESSVHNIHIGDLPSEKKKIFLVYD